MKFKDIKVGDKVVISREYGLRGNDYVIAEVTRLTKTLIVVKNEKFSKETGYEYPRPSEWNLGDCIYHVTDEMLEKVERTKLGMMAYKLKTYDYGKLVDDNPELLKEIFSKLIS